MISIEISEIETKRNAKYKQNIDLIFEKDKIEKCRGRGYSWHSSWQASVRFWVRLLLQKGKKERKRKRKMLN